MNNCYIVWREYNEFDTPLLKKQGFETIEDRDKFEEQLLDNPDFIEIIDYIDSSSNLLESVRDYPDNNIIRSIKIALGQEIDNRPTLESLYSDTIKKLDETYKSEEKKQNIIDMYKRFSGKSDLSDLTKDNIDTSILLKMSVYLYMPIKTIRRYLGV